jgi:hypothetical protein
MRDALLDRLAQDAAPVGIVRAEEIFDLSELRGGFEAGG